MQRKNVGIAACSNWKLVSSGDKQYLSWDDLKFCGLLGNEKQGKRFCLHSHTCTKAWSWTHLQWPGEGEREGKVRKGDDRFWFDLMLEYVTSGTVRSRTWCKRKINPAAFDRACTDGGYGHNQYHQTPHSADRTRERDFLKEFPNWHQE